MLLTYFAALTFVCSASAASLKVNPYFPFGGYAVAGFPYTGAYTGGAYAGTGGAYAGTGGAFAGTGAGLFGPGFPFTWTGIPYPVIPPIPIIPFPIPWYEGENVCNETYVSKAKMTDGIPGWASILSSDNNYQQSSETCRGDEKTYVCKKEKQTPEGLMIEYTKYQCCLGFVNSPYDSRCLESPKAPSGGSTAVPPTEKPNAISDYNRYEFHRASSSGVQLSGVQSVPAQ